MADWTGYVGMALGLYGAYMGHKGYVRANQVKALDLRLELRKGLGDAHESVSTLRELMDEAERSRAAVNAMVGRNGGAVIRWGQTLQVDETRLEQLSTPLRSQDADFLALSPEQLEKDIVATHGIKRSLTALIVKYQAELAADNDARRLNTERVNATTAAIISKR